MTNCSTVCGNCATMLIFIRSKHPARQRYMCVYERMSNVTGVADHSFQWKFSSFSDKVISHLSVCACTAYERLHIHTFQRVLLCDQMWLSHTWGCDLDELVMFHIDRGFTFLALMHKHARTLQQCLSLSRWGGLNEWQYNICFFPASCHVSLIHWNEPS